MPSRILALENDALASELAKFIIEAQNNALETKSHFDIAISGGSQAATLAQGLLKNHEVKWSQWRVWLADERIVPLDHEDSNWFLFQQHVLDKLSADQQPEKHTLSTELLKDYTNKSYTEFAAEYQSQLVEALGEQPKLDVALLGMGPDGHTCSLFPGHNLLEESKLLVTGLDDSPKPPPKRITLTLPCLELAEQIIFLASGAAKKDAIHRIFKENDTSLPTKRVIDAAKNPVIFLTDPAALGQ